MTRSSVHKDSIHKNVPLTEKNLASNEKLFFRIINDLEQFMHQLQNHKELWCLTFLDFVQVSQEYHDEFFTLRDEEIVKFKGQRDSVTTIQRRPSYLNIDDETFDTSTEEGRASLNERISMVNIDMNEEDLKN